MSRASAHPRSAAVHPLAASAVSADSGAAREALARRVADLAAKFLEAHREALELPDRRHLLELPAAWLPPLPTVLLRVARGWLQDHEPSALVRARALELLMGGAGLAGVVAGGYPRSELLALAAFLSWSCAAALLERWPEGTASFVRRRGEEAEELRLFGQDAGVGPHGIHPWVSDDTLATVERGSADLRARLLNGMAWLRLSEPVTDTWMAEALFPRLARLFPAERVPRGCLIWTVGAPLAVQDAAALVRPDLVVETADFLDAGRPSTRRQKITEEVVSRLRLGRRVLCVGNHTTAESRGRLIGAARALGARVEALFFDLPEALLAERNAAAGFPTSPRSLEHALEGLQAPHPHEAETVWVLEARGPAWQWTLDTSPGEGFQERPWPPSTAVRAP